MSNQSFSTVTITRTLTGVVVANTFLTPLGATAGADANTLGVVLTDGAVGAKVPVAIDGTAVVLSGAAFADGATLKSDASGKAITWAAAGAKVALALQAATAANQLIEVFLIDNVA